MLLFRSDMKSNTTWKPGSPNLARHSVEVFNSSVRNSWPLEDNSPPPLPPRGSLKVYKIFISFFIFIHLLFIISPRTKNQ